MRSVAVFIAVIAVVLAATQFTLRGPQAVRLHPPAPSAEEEAGESPGALEPGVRVAPPVQASATPEAPGTRAIYPPAARRQAGQPGSAITRSNALPEQPSRHVMSQHLSPEGAVPAPFPGAAGAEAGSGPQASAALPTKSDQSDRSPVVMPPVLLGQPAASYPSEGYHLVLERDALTAQLKIETAQGRVVLRLLVRADGSVGRVEVAETSGNPTVDDAAVRTAAGWTFAPATRNAEPIEAWVVIPVRFVVP